MRRESVRGGKQIAMRYEDDERTLTMAAIILNRFRLVIVVFGIRRDYNFRTSHDAVFLW